MQKSIVFLLRVQCRRKESTRSLSHLLMSFLFKHSVSNYTYPLKIFAYTEVRCVDWEFIPFATQLDKVAISGALP